MMPLGMTHDRIEKYIRKIKPYSDVIIELQTHSEYWQDVNTVLSSDPENKVISLFHKFRSAFGFITI